MAIFHMAGKLKADGVERIEGELAKLNLQGAALVTEIERLEAQKDELESADDLLAAMAAVQAARNRQRKLDIQIAMTRERLAAAKDASRAKLLGDLMAAYTPAARDFLNKARATQTAHGALVAAREALHAAGFRREYNSLPFPPTLGASVVLAADLLENFEAQINGSAPARAVANPVRAAIAPPAVKAAPKPRRSTAVRLDEPSPPRPKPRPLLRETAGAGEVLFHLHRNGLGLPDRGILMEGDVISLTRDKALPLIRNGVGDIITAEALAKLDASDAMAGRIADKEAAE